MEQDDLPLNNEEDPEPVLFVCDASALFGLVAMCEAVLFIVLLEHMVIHEVFLLRKHEYDLGLESLVKYCHIQPVIAQYLPGDLD